MLALANQDPFVHLPWLSAAVVFTAPEHKPHAVAEHSYNGEHVVDVNVLTPEKSHVDISEDAVPDGQHVSRP